MSGGLFVNALLRETGRAISKKEAGRLQELHARAFRKRVKDVRPLPGARDLLRHLHAHRWRMLSWWPTAFGTCWPRGALILWASECSREATARMNSIAPALQRPTLGSP